MNLKKPTLSSPLIEYNELPEEKKMQELTAFKELNDQDDLPSNEQLFAIPELFYRSIHYAIRLKFRALSAKEKDAFKELLKVPCLPG